jgi:hypothetical protein
MEPLEEVGLVGAKVGHEHCWSTVESMVGGWLNLSTCCGIHFLDFKWMPQGKPI